jgi:hypothetical protein
MNLQTTRIADIKIEDTGKLTPITRHPPYLRTLETLAKLDQGHKPETPDEHRAKQIYDSIRIRGWNPRLWGHIQAHRKNGHTVLWSGTHRLAALTHLGHTHVQVHICDRQHLRRGHW